MFSCLLSVVHVSVNFQCCVYILCNMDRVLFSFRFGDRCDDLRSAAECCDGRVDPELRMQLMSATFGHAVEWSDESSVSLQPPCILTSMTTMDRVGIFWDFGLC